MAIVSLGSFFLGWLCMWRYRLEKRGAFKWLSYCLWGLSLAFFVYTFFRSS